MIIRSIVTLKVFISRHKLFFRAIAKKNENKLLLFYSFIRLLKSTNYKYKRKKKLIEMLKWCVNDLCKLYPD